MPAPHKRPRKKASPKQPKPKPGECIDPGCGRKSYARGLCQAHHRQMLTTGKLKPIRPYRKRSPETVKFSGLRVTRLCAKTVKAYAKKRGISYGAAIAEILEDSLINGPKEDGGEP